MKKLRHLPKVEPLDERAERSLKRLERAIRLVLDELGPTVPLRHMEVLLAVYELEPVDQADIQRRVVGGKSAIHATLVKLGDTDRFGKRGFGVVSKRWSDDGRRRRLYTLTPYGREFAERYLSTLVAD